MDFLHGGACSPFLKYWFLIDLISSELHKSAPSESQQGSQISHELSEFFPPEATSFSAGIPHVPQGTEWTNVSNPLEKSLGIGASFSPSLCNDANVLFLISSHKAEMNPQRAAVCFTKSCTTSSRAAHDAFPILQMNLEFLELISSFMVLSQAEASSLTWNNSTNPSKMGFANYIPC